MKIVLANKYYYLRGGAERHLFDLQRLLEENGHQVLPFAMQDPQNRPTPLSKYFVSPVQTERVRGGWQGLCTAGRMLYSLEARRKFTALLADEQPDLVHAHNIYHQLSPSILTAARRRGVPAVMTAHDYKLIAPNYSLFHDGAICEATKPARFWKDISHRCVKGSRLAGALSALEMEWHRAAGLYLNNLETIIVPSRFMKALFVDYGLPEDKLAIVPHFIDPSAWEPKYGGNYALYVGRLSPEKGVDVLIRAAARVKEVPVRIVGTGPEEKRLRRLAKEVGAANVEFRGYRQGEKLQAEYAGARFMVVPSIWYEVFGLVALEANAMGKPVIASELGGLPEAVSNGETGVLVSAGDDEGLASVMQDLWQDPERCELMGRAGRQWAESAFTPQKYYEHLLKIYEEAIGLSE